MDPVPDLDVFLEDEGLKLDNDDPLAVLFRHPTVLAKVKSLADCWQPHNAKGLTEACILMLPMVDDGPTGFCFFAWHGGGSRPTPISNYYVMVRRGFLGRSKRFSLRVAIPVKQIYPRSG